MTNLDRPTQTHFTQQQTAADLRPALELRASVLPVMAPGRAQFYRPIEKMEVNK